VRLLIADDDSKVRAALRLVAEEVERQRADEIDPAPGWIIIEAADSTAALLELRRAPIDVLLLDWELPGIEPQEMVGAARECGDPLVVAMSGRPEARGESLDCGADSFISKSDPPDALVSALLTRSRRADMSR
jgi:DNA-binding NarL/FixJ family response regulator